MTPQIQFFQAAATAIPTLLVAVLFTSKAIDRVVSIGRVPYLVFAAVCGYAIFHAEVVALHTLQDGVLTADRADLVWGGLWAELLILAAQGAALLFGKELQALLAAPKTKAQEYLAFLGEVALSVTLLAVAVRFPTTAGRAIALWLVLGSLVQGAWYLWRRRRQKSARHG